MEMEMEMGRKAGRRGKIERERERLIFPYLDFSNACNSWNWIRLKPWVEEFIRNLSHEWQGPNYLSYQLHPRECRSWNSEQSQDCNSRIPIWDADVRNGVLTARHAPCIQVGFLNLNHTALQKQPVLSLHLPEVTDCMDCTDKQPKRIPSLHGAWSLLRKRSHIHKWPEYRLISDKCQKKEIGVTFTGMSPCTTGVLFLKCFETLR